MTSNQDVAEAFANHKKKTTKNSFSEGDIIYSYGHHFPMAVWKGNEVLVTKDKYSSSTSRHQSELRQALISNNISYKEVPLSEVNKEINDQQEEKLRLLQMEAAKKQEEERIKREQERAKRIAEGNKLKPLSEVIKEYNKEKKRMRA